MISTLTRAELTEELNRRISVTEKYPDLETAQIDAIICKLALAALESEPVAYIFKHPAGRLLWSLTDKSNKGHDDVMPVYASPQPAPVVPEEMTPQQASRSYGGEVRGYRAGWNACRAAMLQELKKVQELKRSAGVTKMCRCCTPNLRRNPIAARRKTTFLRSKTATLQRKARDGFR